MESDMYNTRAKFIKTLVPASDTLFESDSMLNVLKNENDFILEKISKQPKEQRWRRIFIRSLFAFIETLCFRLKQDALEFNKFSSAEESILNEKTYVLNNKGEVEAKVLFLKTPENLRFSFNAFAKAVEAKFVLKVDDVGWDSFKQSLKVRHKITHPKKFNDLVISDDEFQKVISTMHWIYGQTIRLFDAWRNFQEELQKNKK